MIYLYPGWEAALREADKVKLKDNGEYKRNRIPVNKRIKELTKLIMTGEAVVIDKP